MSFSSNANRERRERGEKRERGEREERRERGASDEKKYVKEILKQ